MTRPTQRRLLSVVLVALGLALALFPLIRSPSTTDWPNPGVFYGVVFLVAGVLGLAGFEAVFRHGPLDPRLDADREPSAPQFISLDRVGEQPGLGENERWLPLRYAAFPQRCAQCGQPAARAWRVQAKRGVDFVVAYAYRVGVLAVPMCRACHGRRRALQWLCHALPALAFGAWLAVAPVGLDLLAPEVAGTAALCSLFGSAALVRRFGARLADRAMIGVWGRKLDRDGLAGVFGFRDPELAREVTQLTRRALPGVGSASDGRARREA